MSRARLLKASKSAALVVGVAAIAIALFGNAEFPAAITTGKFWTTLAMAGFGGFLGGIFQKEPKAKNP